MSSRSTNPCRLYILDAAGEPVPEPDVRVWSKWLEAAMREGRKPLGDDTVGPYRVSTVFLGVDHQWCDGGPAILWETMVFGLLGEEFCGRRYRKEVYCERYASKCDALAGHARAVKYAESLPAPTSACASS